MTNQKNITTPFYKHRAFYLPLLILVIALTGILVINTWIMKQTETERANIEGQRKLSGIATEVESNLYEAECFMDSVIGQLQMFLETSENVKEELPGFIKKQKTSAIEKTNGRAYSVYISYQDYLYIDGFTPGDDFVLAERSWYIGAKKKQGKLFVTSPYVDPQTGKMSYSVSIWLPEYDSIIGIDYAMDGIQEFIERMSDEETENSYSLIVNENGMIIGHTNTAFVGKNYSETDYPEIIKKVFQLYGDSFEYDTEDGSKFSVYSDKTSYDWYLIVCVNNQDLTIWKSKEIYLVFGFILLLSLTIVVFYIVSYRNKNKAEKQLYYQDELWRDMSTELRHPINSLVNETRIRQTKENKNDDYDAVVWDALERMNHVLDQSLQMTQKQKDEYLKAKQERTQVVKTGKIRKHNIVLVAVVLVATAIFSVIANTRTQIQWGNAHMELEMKEYFFQTKEWVMENKETINFLAHTFTMSPELVEDYESAVKYMDDMVSGNDDISVAYIVNPKWEHTVIMNNGWEPNPDWHVEERPWYLETMSSENENGFNVSTPYLDEQTGLYCVTISQIAYDRYGNMIGLLGIDYYLDKLITILGESYTDNGYAFLTDSDYTILNHPYSGYEMTSDSSFNAGTLGYRKALTTPEVTLIKDYDNKYKVCLVMEEEVSGFSVVVVKNWVEIYGQAVFSDIVLLIVFIVCFIVVMSLLNRLNKLQEAAAHELFTAAENAKAASKAKSDFLAQMSHEIRTPINAVLGMNEMVLRESKEINTLEYSRNIRNAGKTLLNLINSILDFSKIEDGKMEILPTNYSTASLINDLVQMTRVRIEDKHLEFHVDIDPELPSGLYGDDVRIRQVISNLLTNAVKYTKEGSVTFRMMKKQFAEGKILLRVEVEDTGIGIREEDMEKLKQTFQRLDQEKNRNIEGTGLGISIVRKLLELMDSEIEISSVYGKGSIFAFNLWQQITDTAEIGDYKLRLDDMSTKKKQEVLHASKAKILVVDDNEMNLKVASGLLKRCNIIADTADGGESCIEKVSKNKYHVILMDHMMPDPDGIRTLEILRERNLLPVDTRVIMMTANAVTGAKDFYMEAGFDGYLTKPIEVDKLEATLRAMLPDEAIDKEKPGKNPMDSMKKPAEEPQVMKAGSSATSEEKKPEPAAAPEPTVVKTAEPEPELQNDETEEREAMDERLEKLKLQIPEIKPEVGLTYCMDSADFYLEILSDYADENKDEILGDALAKKDMKAYAITVHALKSTSKTLGAVDLAENALRYEMAAKANDLEFVSNNHEALMEQYKSLKNKIHTFLSE